MAGQIGKLTRVQQRASGNIAKALERARNSMADIPLGETRYDPRTQKKRDQQQQTDPLLDTTLTRLTHQMGKQNG